MSDRAPPEGLIDPDVTVPAAVKAFAAKAEELHKQAYAPEEPVVDDAAPAAEEAPNGDLKLAPAAPAEPAPQPEPVTTQGNEGVDWQAKYQSFKDSMEGRFKRQEAAIRDLTARNEQLSQLVAELNSAPKETQVERLITPEEENDYGKELLDVVGKRAKEVVSPEVAELKQHISKLEAQLQGVTGHVARTAQQEMYSYLDEHIPNWGELNNNPEFLRWLDLPDMYSGAIRRNLLNAAYGRNNGPQVAAFFKGFISDEAATNPATLQRPSVTPAGSAQVTPKASLEQFAAPGRAKTAAATAPAEKPTISRADISQFYRDVAAGKYRGRETEQSAMEQRVFAAQREGRIR